jgi:hypothetical protein
VSANVPHLIGPKGDPTDARPLARRDIGPGSGLDELWLQRLVHEHPSILPTASIEPDYDRLLSVCMELPLASGFADNLLITPRGKLALVETKLFRNPEARRKVVAQILDYAKDLSALGLEGLESAVARATGLKSPRLFDVVSGDVEGIDEATFNDRIARDLRLGRFLLLVVGDGIREGAAHLVDHLNDSMSLQHTLAVVELKIWETGTGDLLVVPSVPFKTETVVRAIVRIDDRDFDRVSVQPAGRAEGAIPQPATMSERDFLDAAIGTAEPRRVAFEAFRTAASERNLSFVLNKDMMVKGRLSSGREVSIGLIRRDGRFDTTYANWVASEMGRIDLAHALQKRLAALVDGGRVKETSKVRGWYVVDAAGAAVPIDAILDEPTPWLEAFDHFLRDLEIEARSNP